jgi:hypothetical protein
MQDGPLLLMALLAAAPANAAPAATSAEVAARAGDRCASLPPSDNPNEIVVCAPRQEGYRLDPDIMEARRLAKKRGRPTPPERLRDNSCKVVGPMGCGPPAGINIISAAITAATMIDKAIKGENVGKMFITDPQMSEYQIYVALKRQREAEEAEQAAKLTAKTAAPPKPQ